MSGGRWGAGARYEKTAPRKNTNFSPVRPGPIFFRKFGSPRLGTVSFQKEIWRTGPGLKNWAGLFFVLCSGYTTGP